VQLSRFSPIPIIQVTEGRGSIDRRLSNGRQHHSALTPPEGKKRKRGLLKGKKEDVERKPGKGKHQTELHVHTPEKWGGGLEIHCTATNPSEASTTRRRDHGNRILKTPWRPKKDRIFAPQNLDNAKGGPSSLGCNFRENQKRKDRSRKTIRGNETSGNADSKNHEFEKIKEKGKRIAVRAREG